MTRRSAAAPERLHAVVSGRVQGVGFRYWVREQAQALGLCGLARNLGGGGVEVLAEGDRPALEELARRLQRGPSNARVTNVQLSWSPAQGDLSGFRIRPDAF